MEKLAKEGKYELDAEDFAKIKESFVGFFTDEEMTKATIKSTMESKNYLIDTHTAVAVNAANEYMKCYEAERKILIASTASPYKFAKDVLTSLVGEERASQIGDIEALAELADLTGQPAPTPLTSVTVKKPLHTKVIAKEDMDNAVVDFVN
jgi:threonine synthase